MTNKLEELKKKMEEAEVACGACDATRNAARNAARNANAAYDAAGNAAFDAALDAHAAYTAYNNELIKNNNNNES